MKYFAILKDSLREALDSKVLYVMIGLSTIVIGIVGTLTFKPVSAEKTMAMFFPDPELKHLSLIFLSLHNQEFKELTESPLDPKKNNLAENHLLARMGRLSTYRLESVTLLRGEPDSPDSDYVLTIIDVFPRQPDGQDDATTLQKAKDGVREIFQRADEFGLIRIGDIEAAPEGKENALGTRWKYRVQLHSTPRTRQLWGAEPSLFFVLPLPVPPAPLGYQLYVLSRLVILFGSWIAINVGVIVTSFFMPSMLSKGTVDMLLVKPIHRWALLLYKYIGGLTFIFLNGAYAIGGMWLVIGLRSGVWPSGCLLLVLTMTLFFAILYAISTYVAVLTRSIIASIVLTMLAWFAFFLIGWGNGEMEKKALAEQWAEKAGKAVPAEDQWGGGKIATTVHLLHAVTPRTEDLNQLNDLIVYCDLITGSQSNMAKLGITRRQGYESLLVAGIWIAIFLGLACAWFTFKDY